ncbi:MAG TPA: rhodanese-like domain-containing protein [Terrimicrobiaceae bacterium]
MPKLVNSWAASVLLRLAKLQVAEKHGERFLKLAAEARSRITEISAAETAVAIKRGALLLDVRERDEYLRGHIPNAEHLARGTLELEIEKWAPDPETEIVTYCGAGNRSALAAENLQRMGYKNVRSLAGGLQAWVDAGLPTWRRSHPIED